MLFRRLELVAVLAGTTIGLLGCAAPKAQVDACTTLLSPAIENSCISTPGILFRGSKPDSEGATALAKLGVRTVVNLELRNDDKQSFAEVRADISPPLTIGYFRIREWEPNVVVAPAVLDIHVAEFIAITKTQPKPIYVHCRSGQNRTGVMVAAYRVLVEGQPIEAAVTEMQRYKGFWFNKDATYVRSLVGDHRAKIEAKVASRISSIREDAVFACSQNGCNVR